MFKWTFFILVIVYIRYSYSTCSVDVFGHHLFGAECNYLCHCAGDGQCDDVTGECQAGCADYWMGPGCQYRDIARGKDAIQLNTLPDKDATLAVDGNMSTCSETNLTETGYTRSVSSFWRLLSGHIEAIRGIQITPAPESLRYFVEGFNVTVENISSVDSVIEVFYPIESQICYIHSHNTSLQPMFEILCDGYVFGNQIRIQLSSNDSQLALCDVKVYGGRNVAFKQTASQNGDDRLCTCPASLAVDGNTLRNRHHCTYGALSNPHWWMVDFNHLYFVHAINIAKYNNDRLRNYFLQTRQTNFSNWSNIYKDIRQNPSVYVTFAVLSHGLRIFRSFLEKLRICEIQIFGDCPEYKCGFDCSVNCFCNKRRYIEYVSGNCTSDCLDGWWGYNEKCDQECRNGSFGANCLNACSSTCKYGCDKHNGTCIGVCVPGWKGTFCDTECVNGSFGANCTNTCNATCANGCDKENGACIGDCVSGWSGNFCENECENGSFGANCINTCSLTCESGCDKKNGTCIGGCMSGWSDIFCETVSEKHYGSLSIPAIVGTTIGVLGLLCMAVLFVQFLNRRHIFNRLLQHKETTQHVEWSKESEVSPYVNISHVLPNGSRGSTADKESKTRVDQGDNYQTLIISSSAEGHYSTLQLSNLN